MNKKRAKKYTSYVNALAPRLVNFKEICLTLKFFIENIVLFLLALSAVSAQLVIYKSNRYAFVLEN